MLSAMTSYLLLLKEAWRPSVCKGRASPWLALSRCEGSALGPGSGMLLTAAQVLLPSSINAQEKGWGEGQKETAVVGKHSKIWNSRSSPWAKGAMADCRQGRRQGGGSAGLCMTISAVCICNDSTGRECNTKILDLCVILHWGQMSSLVLYTVNAISVPNPNDSPHPAPSPLPSAANGTDGWKKRIAIFKKQKKPQPCYFCIFSA